MKMPHGRRSSLCLYVPIHKIAPTTTAMIVSMMNLLSNGTVQMSAVVPITNKILKILLPTIFPIAIPAFPFRAAATDVTSSGSEVPSATIVSPINRSLLPNYRAIADAPLTAKSLPFTTSTPPITMKRIHFHTG